MALLLDVGNPTWHAQRHDYEAAARGLGVHLLSLEVQGPDEFAGAFQAALHGRAQALIMMLSPLFGAHGRTSPNWPWRAGCRRCPAMWGMPTRGDS